MVTLATPASDVHRSRGDLPASGPRAALPRVLSRELVVEVVERVVKRVVERARASGPRLDDRVLETLYAERLRLAYAGRARRSRRDREFLKELRQELVRSREIGSEHVVRRIVKRYADEIAGDFDPRVYRLATKLVPAALAAVARSHARGRVEPFADEIRVQGETAALRALAERGTLILAPTHVSNVDALVMGLVLHRLGLPPFAYGAGLNLYSNAVMSFFMNHLGAYTIDRQKTDRLYRETLKEFVTVLLERGQHNLVFPGGTRSRSGAIETRLKKGLIGTAPAAFRHALESRAPRAPVFVVPCTLSYPVVLEASTLIGDYLRTEGGPQYLDVRDEFDNPRRWVDFLRGVAGLEQGVYVRFSRPFDWLGNEVDADGVSRDARGRPISIDAYLRVGGRLVADRARDTEYTRQLSTRLVEAYRRAHVVLPGQLVAFVLFERFRRGRLGTDLLRLLRGPSFEMNVRELLPDLERARDEVGLLEARSAIQAAPGLTSAAPAGLLEQALATFAAYHGTTVIERRGDRLCVADPELLFYYRNRLEGYGLLGAPDVLASIAASRRRWP